MQNVSREVIDQLKEYQSLLLKWNKTINLISSSTIDDFWSRHIVDSMQLFDFIEDKDLYVVDLGSGGGLPGIVLSILGIKKMTLIESDSRKAAFLLQAAKISDNQVDIINDRIENTEIDCDVVVSRAFSEISNIFTVTKGFKIREKYLLLKGERVDQEIDRAHEEWLFKFDLHGSITSEKGKIVEIRNVNERKNSIYC